MFIKFLFVIYLYRNLLWATHTNTDGAVVEIEDFLPELLKLKQDFRNVILVLNGVYKYSQSMTGSLNESQI